MEKKNIYFFDLNEILLDRYPARISECINQASTEGVNFVFIYTEVYNSSKPKPQRLPSNSVLIYDVNLSSRKLRKIVEQYPPAAYVSVGLRLPDIFLHGFFNKLRVPTFMVQHGIFVKHLSRIPLPQLILNKARKFYQYFIYASRISSLTNESLVKTLKELYMFYLKGTVNLPELKSLTKVKLISQKAFIFDESWNDYYEGSYGYSKKDLIYFGNPDYCLVKGYDDKPVEDAICYICQSLVEDGRFPKKEYLKFLRSMKRQLSGKKLYLKLHPRSKLELYEDFEDENFILTKEFKNCTFYLGHYSSLLEVAYQLGRHVVLWRLDNHEIPKSFFKYGQIVTSSWKEVNEFLYQSKNNDFVLKDGIIEFFNSELDPYEVIASEILKSVYLLD